MTHINYIYIIYRRYLLVFKLDVLTTDRPRLSKISEDFVNTSIFFYIKKLLIY